jgi:hypothetical protein
MRARTADAALDRPDLALADRRGVREAQAVRSDQKDRLALMAGQLRQRIPEIRGDRPSVLVRDGRRSLEKADAHDLVALSLLAVEVDEPIAQDRRQPGAQIGALLKAIEMRPRAQQRVLNQVVGLVPAAA